MPWWRESPYLAATLINVASSSCSLAALGPIKVVSSAKSKWLKSVPEGAAMSGASQRTSCIRACIIMMKR